MSEKKEIFVPIGTFDKSRVSFSRPKENKFIKNKTQISWYTSEAFYKDANDEDCTAYIELPKQYCFGFNPKYDFDVDEEDRSEDDLKGWQVCYSLTSIKTVENPTEDEQAAIDMCNDIYDLALDSFRDECSKPKKDRRVPPATLGSYNNIITEDESERDWSEGVKPIYTRPKMKGDKSRFDESKPYRMYLSLITTGSGRNLRVISSIRGKGNVNKSPSSFENVPGIIHPVIKLEGLYWGQHGATKPYGCSVKFFLAQCNYLPGDNSGPSHFFLPPLEAEEINEENSSNDPPTGNPEGFEEEGGGILEKKGSSENSEGKEDGEETKKLKSTRPKRKKKLKKRSS